MDAEAPGVEKVRLSLAVKARACSGVIVSKVYVATIRPPPAGHPATHAKHLIRNLVQRLMI
jgi:hypothetical protein